MRKSYILPVFLIFAAILLRVLRHFGIIDLPPNFAPITAIALFAGTYLEDRRLAIVIPLGAMVMSDFFIGFYNIGVLISVYASFFLAGLLGFWIRKNKSVLRVTGATVVGSVLFFFITNTAVWLFSGMYVPTLSGLGESYLMGLPFFKWTFLSDILYVALLFGLYETITLCLKSMRTQPVPSKVAMIGHTKTCSQSSGAIENCSRAFMHQTRKPSATSTGL